jgi:glycosyltransferase involved in cell wall biosynthesis
LRVCLQSVCTEITRFHLEKLVQVIVSDNCSNDDTTEVVRTFQAAHPAISMQYTRNPENVGAVNNFIGLVEISTAVYTYILGDDDRLGEGALYETVGLIGQHEEILVFHLKCFQTDFIPRGMPPLQLDIYQAAEKYFYNIGNAGTFIIRTAPAQEFLSTRKERIAKTCWPQTEIMFGILLQQKHQKAFLASGIELVVSESHDANVVYNSWYIVETFCFSLLRILQNLDAEFRDSDFVRRAKRAIPACRMTLKFFFRFLLFITYYDYPYELDKTRNLIAENRKQLKGRISFYPNAYQFLMALPISVKKFATFCYLFTSRPAFSRGGISGYYEEIDRYRANKHRIYAAKGKLSADSDRYIY